MTTEPRRGGSFRILRQRNFVTFWVAAIVSNTGTWMQAIAVPYVVYRITGSTTWLGIGAFAALVPSLLVAPWAGSIADRHRRKRVLLVTQTAMMLTTVVLWVAWVAGVRSAPLIVGLVALTGLIGGINITSWQAFVTQLVEPDDVIDAVRLNTVQFTAARAFGPALAGLVLQFFGPGTAFFANAASYLVVLGALVLIRPRAQILSADRSRALRHFLEGLRLVRADAALLIPVLVIGLVSVFGSSVLQMAPAIAHEMFGVGRGAYGVLVGAFGGGAIVGSFLVSLFADRVPRSGLACTGLVAMGGGIVVLGLVPTYGLGLAAMGVMGLSYMFITMSLQTGLQVAVSDDFRGRAIALYLAALMAGVPFGALIEGNLASVVDLRVVIVGAGVGLLGVVVVSIGFLHGLRPLDGTGSAPVDDVDGPAGALPVPSERLDPGVA